MYLIVSICSYLTCHLNIIRGDMFILHNPMNVALGIVSVRNTGSYLKLLDHVVILCLIF